MKKRVLCILLLLCLLSVLTGCKQESRSATVYVYTGAVEGSEVQWDPDSVQYTVKQDDALMDGKIRIRSVGEDFVKVKLDAAYTCPQTEKSGTTFKAEAGTALILLPTDGGKTAIRIDFVESVLEKNAQ